MHILICREAELIGHGKWGPIPGDSRILYEQDVSDYREVFRNAHAAGLLKHDNYKLIQMVRNEHIYHDDARARNIVMSMDGVAYEEH